MPRCAGCTGCMPHQKRKSSADASLSCTTFLLAAEVYPISVRATAHGLSAAAGKLGALIPAIMYNYVDARTRFWVVCWFGFAGWIVTELFIPDTTGLDLREQDRYWAFVREGRAGEYHGIAVHPRHLSFWERVVLKRGRAYDPELDRQQRVKELRVVYEARMQQQNQFEEESGGGGKGGKRRDGDDEDDEAESELTKNVHTYFLSTSPLFFPMILPVQVADPSPQTNRQVGQRRQRTRPLEAVRYGSKCPAYHWTRSSREIQNASPLESESYDRVA